METIYCTLVIQMTDCRGIKLLAGNSNLELAAGIAHHLGVRLGKTTVTKFSNGEINGIYVNLILAKIALKLFSCL